MDILFVAPSAYLLGGVQDWLYSTVVGLRGRGHKVRLGVPDGYFHDGERYNNEFKGLNAEFIRNRSGTNEGRVRALESFILRREPELVVGVNIGNLFDAVARLKNRNSLKFAMTVHALEANYFEDIRMHRQIIDGLVTTNRLSFELARNIGGLDDDRICYAPYGVPIDMERTMEDSAKKQLRIIWVGRLEQPQKRIKDVIDIVEQLDEMVIDYQLSIAGDGPQRCQVEKAMYKQVTNGKVKFLGRLNKEELSLLYRNHDILLITSQWETGPIVAWEAVSNGCTLVSSKYIGCMAEKTLFDHKTALLFEIGDTKSAACKIAALQEKELRKRIQESAKEIVSQKYSTKASLDAWEIAFNKILKSTNPARPGKIVLESLHRPMNGRMDRYLGLNGSEFIRSVLPKKKPRDAGSEWPHSLQGISDQTSLLEYARKIEDACSAL